MAAMMLPGEASTLMDPRRAGRAPRGRPAARQRVRHALRTGQGNNEGSSPLSLDPAVQKRIDDAAESWATPFLRCR
jgi:hypothetical protein